MDMEAAARMNEGKDGVELKVHGVVLLEMDVTCNDLL